ncbi:MAG: c-type cytochrome [Burkholderiaceae bacterium]
MSDTPSSAPSASSHEEEAHTGPIKNPKQMLYAVAASFILPIFAIIGLVYTVTTDSKDGPGVGDAQKSLALRIQKVGYVEIRDANRELKGGEEVYKTQCASCHAAGLLGAPVLGDAAAWGARIKTGYDALLTSALKGKGAMNAQGGADYEDTEIGRAVVYLANAAGAKFEVPKQPAATAPAGSASAAVAAAPAK